MSNDRFRVLPASDGLSKAVRQVRHELPMPEDASQARRIAAARAKMAMQDYLLMLIEVGEKALTTSSPPSRNEQFFRAERPADVLAWMETGPEPGDAFTDSEGRLWVFPGRGRPPEQDRLASPAENMAGLAACREVLKNAKGPLAKDLRGLLR